jgi:hypothetical protein
MSVNELYFVLFIFGLAFATLIQRLNYRDYIAFAVFLVMIYLIFVQQVALNNYLCWFTAGFALRSSLGRE